jgi:hypothetical protein
VLVQDQEYRKLAYFIKMTVQTDLQTALDAYIQSNFQGSLEEVSADQLPLQNLLKLQSYLANSGGGGAGGAAPKATTAPTTSVASSTSSVTLLALNANRKWASFRNDSTQVAYIAKSATASTSSVYALQPQGYLYFDDYTGVVSAIWVSANGNMRIEQGV